MNQPSRFVALDGMRAVGAFAVLLTHVGFQSGHALQGHLAGPLARLDAGVALFFVVSGFLLFRPHVVAHLDDRPAPGAGRYYWYRATRILPVLWVAVGAAWILIGDAESRLYLAHAALVQIYLPDHYVQGLTQMWSLATEVAFYAILPLLAAVICRGSGRQLWVRHTSWILGALIIAGPLWMLTVTALGEPLARLWLPGFIGWFAAGMLLAVWSVAVERGLQPGGRIAALARYPGTCWSLAFALFAIGTTPLAGPLDLNEPTPLAAAFKNLLYCGIAILVVLPCIPRHRGTPPAGLGLLSGRVGRWLGDISYGIFAYHVVVLRLVDQHVGFTFLDGRFWSRLLLTVTVTVAIAAVSFVAFERPIMRWARRRGQHASAPGEAQFSATRT